MDTDSRFKLRCEVCNVEFPFEEPGEPARIYRCNTCGTQLELIREIRSADSGILQALEDANRKVREQRRSGKPDEELKSGDTWSHKLQKPVHRRRRIDRRSNEYEEVVTDPDTGEVLHSCKERLSEHRGHGSAAPRRPKERSENGGDGKG